MRLVSFEELEDPEEFELDPELQDAIKTLLKVIWMARDLAIEEYGEVPEEVRYAPAALSILVRKPLTAR